MTLTYFNAESGEPGLYPSNRKQLWYLSEAKKKTCRSLLQTKRLIPGRARPRLQIAKRFVDRIFACTTPIALARIVHLVHDIATYPVLSFAFQLAYRGLVTRRSFDPILDMSLDEWFSMTCIGFCARSVLVEFFSRMRSKGSRFTLGVWGLRVCSLDVASASATVRNRPQPFATVRNRSCEDRMAVPMGSSAEVVIFGGFQRFVASFRVAGVALCDIQTCFATC